MEISDMRIASIIFAIIVSVVYAKAQKHGTIINVEDGLPIRDVKIYTNTNKTATTNWLGEYNIYTDFKSATISHGKYMSITLKKEEMRDTIYLLPKMYTLDEVIVWGKRPYFTQSKQIARDASMYAPPGAGKGFDFFSLFKKKPMNKKQRKRHDEIIRSY